jgi:hypothetical protein
MSGYKTGNGELGAEGRGSAVDIQPSCVVQVRKDVFSTQLNCSLDSFWNRYWHIYLVQMCFNNTYKSLFILTWDLYMSNVHASRKMLSCTSNIYRSSPFLVKSSTTVLEFWNNIMEARNQVGLYGLSCQPARLQGWRNRFLGNDPWAPKKFKNTVSNWWNIRHTCAICARLWTDVKNCDQQANYTNLT